MTPLRTVEVAPPVDRETGAVLRACLLIGVIGWLALRAGAAPKDAQGPLLLAHQRPFAKLEQTSWRLCNELLTALREICALQGETGAWPSPAELSEELVVPFSPMIGVAGEIRYRWQREERAGVVSYLGRPERSAELPALLLQLKPAGAPGPVHRRLVAGDGLHVRTADGKLMHYAIWLKRSAVGPRPPLRPEYRGWTQVVTAGGARVQAEEGGR